MKNRNTTALSIIFLDGLSVFGNTISSIAIPWFVLTITNDPLMVGVVVSTQMIPIILTSIFNGRLINKFGELKISLFCDALNFITMLLIPLLFSISSLNVFILVVLVFLSSSLDVPGGTSKEIMLATQIKKRSLSHEKINGLNSSIVNFCDLLGPAIAGILISIMTVVYVLYIDSITFLIAFIGFLAINYYSPLARSKHTHIVHNTNNKKIY